MPLYGLLSPLDSSTPTIKIEKKKFTVGNFSLSAVARKSRVSVAGYDMTCASGIKLADEVQLGDANFVFDKAPVQETPHRSKSEPGSRLRAKLTPMDEHFHTLARGQLQLTHAEAVTHE
ncbi:hypothetical protein M514_04047 [Trichuris suis]|uniref:Uncharacterized protein n=1 Tax=Trichuris suis TaxID=68888 RepID=A0A085MD33_9BILA|nr:hypothetical protein M513_04047 [Trichuris suis]KFD72519.1 hypothetical protein M514_04047 [Trichuris suis]